MFQALAALAGAVVTVAACYAMGALMIRLLRVELQSLERFSLGFLIGAACLHLVVFAVMALKIAYWPVVVGLLLLVCGADLLVRSRPHGRLPSGSGRTRADREVRPTIFWMVLLFLPFTVLYFFHAWAPESSPDGSGYHLGLVARYVRAHGFERITTDMFASFSGGVEMLFVPAFMIGRHSAAALVHLAFGIALGLAMFAYGRRIGKPWAGAAAALLTYASPVVGIDASSAYNDVALAAVAFGAFYWLQIWDDDRRDLLLIPAGLLCGYAYAVKYTGFVMLPLAMVFVAYRSRRWKALLLVTACSLPMIAPWMIKNWIYVDNPVAPLANRIFRNPYFHVVTEEVLSQDMRRYSVDNKWTLPVEVTLRGEKTTGLIGPVFLLAPLALLALRERAGRRLLAAGVLLLATYFANIGTRFLIPCLPFFSLAMALPLANFPPLLAAMMIFHAVASWPAVIRLYAPHAWGLDRILYKQALRIIPQERYLRQNFPPYSAARFVDANVPKGERVLARSGVPEAYTSREILIGYQAAFNESLVDSLDIGWLGSQQPRVLQTFSFPERTVRRIRVVQTGVGDPPLEQWSVHELRFFDHGVEVPRRPEWRLRAWPNPWDVQLAFDNSPATRWRTWETARPGMYLDVDFGQAKAVDQVRIETSYDSIHIREIVEVMDDAGSWVGIARDPAVVPVDPGPNLRHAATYEMQARGIHYLLMQDGEWGANDIADDPEGWGLAEVAAGYGFRLYRVIP
jgi:hypothetical protein